LAKRKFTITTALPYANGPLHIGHMAGVFIPSDIFVRYLRLRGDDVVFIGGTDEHGVPVTISAKNEGVSPQDVVDKYHNIIKTSLKDFGISLDVFSRTTSPVHKEFASDFFKELDDQNEFIVQETEQYYDEENNQFLADRYITGTCPHCSNENAYGDQCEKCGTSLSATDLINPSSALSGNKPVLKKTKHWFLPLDKYEPWLKEWILEDHKDWKANVYGQCRSWLESGLHPRAVTRDLNWGIPVPVDGGEGKVLYVWFDAPLGYMSASKELFDKKDGNWEDYWKKQENESDNSRLVHFIGKDNIVFHCIIFPSMLKAQGDYILPENVPGMEFMNLEGDKFSTSRNWAVWLHEFIEDFPDKSDVMRYVICANMPETKDSDFSWKDFQNKNNSELVATLGNFVNRTLVLTHKYYDGIVPEKGELTDFDKEIIAEMQELPKECSSSLEKYKFKDAQNAMMKMARLGDKYLSHTEPWKLIKTDEERVKTIMNIALQISASLSSLMAPFLPLASAKLADMLNISVMKWEDEIREDLIVAGHRINKAELLFKKIEDAEIQAQLDKLADKKKENELKSIKAAPVKDETTFDNFTQMDIRVGTIISAEKVKKTKKLLKIQLDTGIDKRTVVSGIAEYFKPEDIIGQQVSVLVNLAPREIKGIESQGMILMAEDKDGSLSFVAPTKEVNAGSEIA